jgi:outer membrane cobalamin receptor
VRKNRKQLLIAGVSAATLASGAAAQTAPTVAKPDEIAEIVVTGSRVIANGDNSPSPVTVVSTQTVLAVQPGTLADALNIMPVFSGSRGSGSNPTSSGTTAGGNGAANQLNLRNLGANRNLVLLDGLRIPPTLNNGIVDVDLIPQMLVQRVDTVTGGVSAIYGSDAISGVVNYIIDKKFNGIKVDLNGGISRYHDAEKYDLGVAGGAKLFGGRGHIEGSVEYRDEHGVLRRSDRPWLNQWGVAGSVAGSSSPAGSAGNPY